MAHGEGGSVQTWRVDHGGVLEVLDQLTTPHGRALVEELTPFDEATALATLAAVRRDPKWADQPQVVAAAATQARLRTRAAARFPGPARWWTADGLEQATRPVVAARHAKRFRAAGIGEVADLGCGAGSDALAMAAAGIEVLAVDRDPAALWALRETAADLGLSIRTELGDVTVLDRWWNAQVPAGRGCPGGAGAGGAEAGGIEAGRAGADGTEAGRAEAGRTGAAGTEAGLAGAGRGCFVDPARRAASGGTRGRRLRPADWSPPWSWVLDLANRVPATGAKVAPGIDHLLLPPDAQTEWTSVDGDLVEAAVWWGPLRTDASRRVATVLRHGTPTHPTTRPTTTHPTSAHPTSAHPTTRPTATQPTTTRPATTHLTTTHPTATQLDDSDGVPRPAVGPVGRWLVEPDPAVIRAGLVSVLAERMSGRLLDPRIAYVTADHRPADSPLGDRFEVLDEVPFARKTMRAWLRSRGFGDVVIKKRGVAVVPEELRAALHLGGSGPTATLVLTRTDAGPRALLVRRA